MRMRFSVRKFFALILIVALIANAMVTARSTSKQRFREWAK
jgi:hypothetical protein